MADRLRRLSGSGRLSPAPPADHDGPGQSPQVADQPMDACTLMTATDKVPRMATIRWPAPAKLNLFLHVNGRRPDGYHELQTLFIFLNHGDWLEFEPLPDTNQLTLSPAIPGVPDEQNLIIR